MDNQGNLIFQKQTTMKIDAAAIHHNVSVIRKKIAPARLIAVVKENGYGMGLQREYEILKKDHIDFYAVTNAEEAWALRSFGCQEDILLMSPSFDPEEAGLLLEKDIIFMLGSKDQADLLVQLGKEKGMEPRVHIAIETGMGRYGFFWNQLPDFSQWASDLKIEGCYSHLHGRPADYEKGVKEQLDRFLQAIEGMKAQGIDPGLRHLSNSAATMSMGSLGLDAVRCGSAVIGKCARGQKNLQNSVWLEAPICLVKEFPKGSSIGYQSCVTLQQDSVLGLVRAGHGDGIMLGYADNPEPLLHGILHLLNVKLRKKRFIKKVTVTSLKSGKSAKVPYVGRSGVAHVMIDLTNTAYTQGDLVRFDVNPLFIHPSIPKIVIKES